MQTLSLSLSLSRIAAGLPAQRAVHARAGIPLAVCTPPQADPLKACPLRAR